jgi:hypothetical protein
VARRFQRVIAERATSPSHLNNGLAEEDATRVDAGQGEQPSEELYPRRSMAVPDDTCIGWGDHAEATQLVEGSGLEPIPWNGAAGEGAIIRVGTESRRVQGGVEEGQLRCELLLLKSILFSE